MIYSTLAITLFRKCTASCSMCCFESNPLCKEELNVDDIKDYINQASFIDEIKKISFTGGEPFMEYERLVDLIAFVKERDMRATTITNGYWATTYDVAYEKLKMLKNKGLDHINISHDRYHKEFIPTKNIVNLLAAARDLKIPSTLSSVKIKNENIGEIYDEIGESIYSSDLKIAPCLPAGGAIKTFVEEDFPRTIDSSGCKCPFGGNLVISYDGNIYPCCSQMIFETGLSIGNYRDMTLIEAIKKIRNNALLYLIRNKQFDYFADEIKKTLNIDLPDKIVNTCELCGLIFKKDNIIKLQPFIMRKINEELQQVKG